MLKTITLAAIAAATLASFAVTPASATTSAQCQKLYEKSVYADQSNRAPRDEFLRCLSNLG